VTADIRRHPPVTGTNLTIQNLKYALFYSRVGSPLYGISRKNSRGEKEKTKMGRTLTLDLRARQLLRNRLFSRERHQVTSPLPFTPPYTGLYGCETTCFRGMVDSGLVGPKVFFIHHIRPVVSGARKQRTHNRPLVRSHEERRCSNLGPTQSRISPSKL